MRCVALNTLVLVRLLRLAHVALRAARHALDVVPFVAARAACFVGRRARPRGGALRLGGMAALATVARILRG